MPDLNAPAVQDALNELRRLIAGFDATPLDAMTATFYIHAFNEYDICVRALFDAIDKSQSRPQTGPEDSPAAERPVAAAGTGASADMTATALAFLRKHGGDAVREALDNYDEGRTTHQLQQKQQEAIDEAIASSLPLDQAARDLGMTGSHVVDGIRDRRLYAFAAGPRWYLPRWQFQPADEPGRLEPIPGLEQIVLTISDDEHPLGIQNFMTTPMIDFNGHSPAGYLSRGGDIQLVVDWLASRDWSI